MEKRKEILENLEIVMQEVTAIKELYNLPDFETRILFNALNSAWAAIEDEKGKRE